MVLSIASSCGSSSDRLLKRKQKMTKEEAEEKKARGVEMMQR